MKYLKTFWYTWKNSFSSAEYYRDVMKAPFSFSLKYFLFFCFLLSIITTIFISIRELSPVNELFSMFPQELIKIYPAELEIRINKGEVTTNVPEPYSIPVSRFREAFDEVRKEIKGLQSDKIENILVIDTKATIADMKKYQTYMLLTKNHLSQYKDDWNIETISLENVNNFTINKESVKKIVSPFIPIFKFIYIFAVPFIFIGSLIFFITSQLVYLLFAAFILFIGAKIMKFSLNYWKAYQMDLHLASIITPFFLLLGALNMKIQFPFLKLLTYSVIGLYIVNSLKKTKTSPIPVRKRTKKSSKRS